MVETFGSGFTATTHSKGTQGDRRLLLFGYDGKVIAGFGASGDALELVDNEDSPRGTVPHLLRFNQDKDSNARAFHLDNPKQCASCHTDKFVFIFKEYRIWGGFLGEKDDRQDPNAKEYISLKATKRFEPFFKHAQEMPGMKERVAAPYYAPGETQQLIAAPNTRLNILLGKRAARALWNRIRFTHAEKYQRVKLLLLAAIRCPEARYPAPLRNWEINPGATKASAEAEKTWNSIWKKFEEEFLVQNPVLAKKWESIIAEANKKNAQLTDVPALKILGYLGVEPHQIILTEQWNQKNPLASFDNYKELMLTYNSSFQKKDPDGNVEIRLASPLRYNSGEIFLSDFLSALLIEDSTKNNPELKLDKDLATFSEFLGPEVVKSSAFDHSEKYLDANDRITKQTGSYHNSSLAPHYCSELRKTLDSLSFKSPVEPNKTSPVPSHK